MNQRQWDEAKAELISIRDWVRFGASCFESAGLFYGHGTDNPWDEAAELVLHAVHLSHEFDAKIIDARLTTIEKNAIVNLFEERIIKKIPVPYLTKRAHYAGFEFYVDNRVLIPRSPIAELIEKQFTPWINTETVTSILDIGTGSGCLSIIAAHYFPEAKIDAVDINDGALAVAKINVTKYDLAQQINLIKSDLFNGIKENKYDVIITNPPYVDAEDMANLPAEFLHEPRLALESGNDGLSHIKQILAATKYHLNPGGILIAEVGNSAAALELAYPEVDFIWLEFERGGSGVFLLTYEQINQIN